VYKNNPQITDALQTEIRSIVWSTNGDELQSFPKPRDKVQGLYKRTRRSFPASSVI
jgi:hypothetical protein